MTTVTVQDGQYYINYYINYHSDDRVNKTAIFELFSIYSENSMAPYFNGIITVPRDIQIEHFVKNSLQSGNCDSLLKAMNYQPKSKSLSGDPVVEIQDDLFFDLETYLKLAVRNPDDGSINSDRSLGKEVSDILANNVCRRSDDDSDLSTKMVRFMHDHEASCAVYRTSADEVATFNQENELVVSIDMYSQLIADIQDVVDLGNRGYYTWENILNRSPITDLTGFYEKYTNNMPLDQECFDISGRNAVGIDSE